MWPRRYYNILEVYYIRIVNALDYCFIIVEKGPYDYASLSFGRSSENWFFSSSNARAVSISKLLWGRGVLALRHGICGDNSGIDKWDLWVSSELSFIASAAAGASRRLAASHRDNRGISDSGRLSGSWHVASWLTAGNMDIFLTAYPQKKGRMMPDDLIRSHLF